MIVKQKKSLRLEKHTHTHYSKLWNRFQMTIFVYKFYFIFNLKIQSNNLGVFRLNNKKSLRLELMNYLSNIGCSNREITDFLNVSNIKKVRTNSKYTPKDVFMGIKKYKQRLNRFTNNQIISLRERLYLEKFFNKD